MNGPAGVLLEAGGPLALSLFVKTALILGVAWLLAILARRSSAAVRHGIWVAALAGVTALPLASVWLPPLEVELPALLRSFPTRSPVAPPPAGGIRIAPAAAGRLRLAVSALRLRTDPQWTTRSRPPLPDGDSSSSGCGSAG